MPCQLFSVSLSAKRLAGLHTTPALHVVAEAVNSHWWWRLMICCPLETVLGLVLGTSLANWGLLGSHQDWKVREHPGRWGVGKAGTQGEAEVIGCKAAGPVGSEFGPRIKTSMQPWFFFFKMWTIFKVFIEFVTILFLSYILDFGPRGMWDLSPLIRDRTYTPSIGRHGLNHWTTREVPNPEAELLRDWLIFLLTLRCWLNSLGFMIFTSKFH